MYSNNYIGLPTEEGRTPVGRGMYHRCVSTGEVGGLREVPEGHRGGVESFADAADDRWSSGLLKLLHNIML